MVTTFHEKLSAESPCFKLAISDVKLNGSRLHFAFIHQSISLAKFLPDSALILFINPYQPGQLRRRRAGGA
jgi:hypothetical protein